tara:strand:- start:1854 stop:2420 length:567 start_codon:yes stop_codon:yes gene_type:complete
VISDVSRGYPRTESKCAPHNAINEAGSVLEKGLRRWIGDSDYRGKDLIKYEDSVQIRIVRDTKAGTIATDIWWIYTEVSVVICISGVFERPIDRVEWIWRFGSVQENIGYKFFVDAPRVGGVNCLDAPRKHTLMCDRHFFPVHAISGTIGGANDEGVQDRMVEILEIDGSIEECMPVWVRDQWKCAHE